MCLNKQRACITPRLKLTGKKVCVDIKIKISLIGLTVVLLLLDEFLNTLLFFQC